MRPSKAMILAAGFGTRMRPLTAHTPKPLLTVNQKPLLQYHLEALHRAGIEEVVINVAHLGDQIKAFVGSGDRFGLRITVVTEPRPLETAGGIINALSQLGDAPFILVNGDVWTDYNFMQLCEYAHAEYSCDETHAHLVLVPNPEHHTHGDFAFTEDGIHLQSQGEPRYTYAGLGLMLPRAFAGLSSGEQALGPLLRQWMVAGQVTGAVYRGIWSDVGTPQRLAALQSR